MKTPRKHAEVIKAWADGAEVETKPAGHNAWSDVINPTWLDDFEYRIKPEIKQPVVRWLWAYWHAARKNWSVTEMMWTEEEASRFCSKMTKIEATRTEFPE